MIILGVNAFHGDSSACLLVDGNLISAVEEERFKRQKHWAGFPAESIRYCLRAASISISDVDVVAVNQDSQANLSKKLAYTIKHRPDLKLVVDRIRNKKKRADLLSLLAKEFPGQPIKAQLRPVEHHLAHLSSAFHCSPFGSAAVVSVDGFGDFASAAWGQGRGNDITVEGRVYFPHSLGVFYQALTQYLGFPNYGDEYKVMGLASYGKPTYLQKLRDIVLLQGDGSFRLNLDYFVHHSTKIEYEWENGYPSVGRLYSDQLLDLLGPSREDGESLSEKHSDLAHSVQSMYEEAFFHLLNSIYEKHPTQAVAVAGGCGMNSVANGRIRANTEFRSVYVQAAAGDAGGAIGAANVVWYEQSGAKRVPMQHAYLGPAFSASEIKEVLENRSKEISSTNCVIEEISDQQGLCDRVVERIMAGDVVGWFQGKMEWGPRALGNRSILGDPRRSDMKEILNLKIKRRESFRPFAPSVLREHVADWFEEDDDVPFMMKVYPIKKEKRPEIPAVCHVDGSGRLQTVHKETNPIYWQLIESFRQKTGVPMLLNTSFNENEPIVCTPEEALNCYLRTNMDVLVLNNYMISRKRG